MGTIVRGVIAYLFLLLMIRVTSRRAAGPAAPIQLILIFLFGGMTIQAVVSDDRSLTNALLGVLTIAWMHRTLSFLKIKYTRIGLVTDGSPVILVENGRWHHNRMRTLHLHDQDVMSAARTKGLQARDEIRHALFERNGEISIIAFDEETKKRRKSGEGN
jgi:uncharacterized membrane protein YcaP (DUF421 family)